MSLAVFIHAAKDLRVEEAVTPALGARDVEVKIAAGGICGSDLHYYFHGGFGVVRLREPMVLGHEISGVVALTGSDVTSVRPGDRIAVRSPHGLHRC